VLHQAMIDAIRARRARKRQAPELLPEVSVISGEGEQALDVEALDAALIKLEMAAPAMARLVELRFFAGLSVPEIAALWQESESTVKRRWKAARLWLAAELQDNPVPENPVPENPVPENPVPENPVPENPVPENNDHA
jgi:RNA polymerase sigma factor (sigma-70 family)